MTLDNFTFGVAHVLSSEFTSDANIDGLMGLARSVSARFLGYACSELTKGQSLTDLKIPTPVEEMANRGLIPAAITSYRIPRRTDNVNDGEITFGFVGLAHP
jgi:hypothetical protein